MDRLVQLFARRTPYTLHLTRFLFGPVNYVYSFDVKDASQGKIQYDCSVSMTKVGSNEKRVNRFNLVLLGPTRGVISCTTLGNQPIHPQILISVHYNSIGSKYVFSGSFDAMRALFSFNRVDDNFGIRTTFLCDVIEMYLDEKSLSISCLKWGYVLKKLTPSTYNFSASENTRVEDDPFFKEDRTVSPPT